MLSKPKVDSQRRSAGVRNVLRSSLIFADVRPHLDLKEHATSSQQQRREWRLTYSHTIEQDVIGLDEDIKKLVAELTKEDNPHGIVSICCKKGLPSSSSEESF
ncbi:hypothetical protein TIFTF001_001467 [Ficus carica]|uniref:Uncharacterized protein n=1 Tax=Ficus carica TaxID=3494 RepID=A0AA87ZG84_FICCA|nr:hypothetical protein TIFTF001_001467 [Ficus carica]